VTAHPPGPLLVICTREKSFKMPFKNLRTVILCGISDVALARNISLTQALHFARDLSIEKIVLLDDDIETTEEHIRALADLAGEGSPVSGLYCVRGEPDRLTVTVVDTDEGKFVLAGLGFCALHTSDLAKLAAASSVFDYINRDVIAFTSCNIGPMGKKVVWMSEDFKFWRDMRVLANAQLKMVALTAGHRGKDENGIEQTWVPSQLAAANYHNLKKE
jgi:hypothetical protein